MQPDKCIYFSESAKAHLVTNELWNFDSLWSIDADWHEQPNQSRRGFSGAASVEIQTEDGPRHIFIKRQENYNVRTLAHPLKGIPTFEREYRSNQKFSQLGVPVVELMYFGKQTCGGTQRAILVSYGLDGYAPLDDYLVKFCASECHVNAVLDSVIEAVRTIHENGYRHGCLYGKHIFVRLEGCAENPSIRMLDFEKAQRVWRSNLWVARDLSQLLRHCDSMQEQARAYLTDKYISATGNTDIRRLLHRELVKKS